MELILQQHLPHQQRAVDVICEALEGVYIKPPVQFYENPEISLTDAKTRGQHKKYTELFTGRNIVLVCL